MYQNLCEHNARLSPLFGVARWLAFLGLLDTFDEVMRSSVRLCFRLLMSFARPCEMAVLAVILLFHARDGGECADDDIWDERAFGELWKDDA